MQRSKVIKYVAFVTVILLLSWGCCQLFRPPNVEVIVPGRARLDSWTLSPGGDKLVYNSVTDETAPYLLFTETGRQVKLDDCPLFIWLDNETLYCGESVIIFNDPPHQVPLNIVKAAEVDVAEILQAVDTVYKIDRVSTFFLALEADIQQNPANNYVITEVDDIEAVLAEVDYITLQLFGESVREFEFGEKVYAPNKEYYFIWENNTTLSIFEAATDEKLSAFKADILLLLGGWAADSSGVYFEIHQTSGFFSFPKPKVIRKLRAPQ